MKPLLNWSAAAASFIGLFFTLHPVTDKLSHLQVILLVVIVIAFGYAAFRDIYDELRRAAKKFRNTSAINKYMFSMLQNSGRCEICSRNASWITDNRIKPLLMEKAQAKEVTFLVHESTPALDELRAAGATIITYGPLGFEPMTRFTIVNAGNPTSSYVAIGSQKLNEQHTIEKLDSSHPTYFLAIDLIRSIKIANDKFTKI